MILALLVGCALRRQELASLVVETIQLGVRVSNWTENRVSHGDNYGNRTDSVSFIVRIERPIALIRIVHRVAQRAQFSLHHCLRHRERVTPLRVDVLMDQG